MALVWRDRKRNGAQNENNIVIGRIYTGHGLLYGCGGFHSFKT